MCSTAVVFSDFTASLVADNFPTPTKQDLITFLRGRDQCTSSHAWLTGHWWSFFIPAYITLRYDLVTGTNRYDPAKDFQSQRGDSAESSHSTEAL